VKKGLRYIIPAALLLAVASWAVPAGAQTEYTIWDIQLTPPALLTNVLLDSVVVTGIAYNGFYAQEPDTSIAPIPSPKRAYSGIWVYTVSDPKNPPFNITGVGNLVTVTGKYNEYYGESEIDFSQSGGGTVTVLGNVTPIEPFFLKMEQAKTGSLTQEDWEGVLIKIDGEDPTMHAAASAISPTSNWWVYNDFGPDSMKVNTRLSTHEFPPVGATVSFVQGPVRYHFNEFKVCPRSNDDIGYAGPPSLFAAWSGGPNQVVVLFSRAVTQATAEDESNYEFIAGTVHTLATRDATNHAKVYLTTDTQTNGLAETIKTHGLISEGAGAWEMVGTQSFNFRAGITPITQIQTVTNPAVQDSSELVGEIVTVRGRCSAPSSMRSNNMFFIQQGKGPWSGIFIANQAYVANLGDSVQVSGRVVEYFWFTEVGYAGFDDFRLLGTGYPAASTTVPISTMIYNDKATTEQYESVLVKVNDARVDSTMGGVYFGEWSLLNTDAPPDTAAMDLITKGGTPNVTYEPCPGDIVDVTGVVRYEYGDFRMLPRNDADITIDYVNPACLAGVPDPLAGLPAPRLSANYPNPFNPLTTIRFELPADTRVTLEVFGVSGARVRTLYRDEAMARGSWVVPWDGTDDAGHAVPSGAYFAHLRTAAGLSSHKMMLLK
jgi:hypothetical protein